MKETLRTITHYCSIILLSWIALPLLLFGALGITLFMKGFFDLPNFKEVQMLPQTSVLYAADGTRIGAYCERCREIIPFEEMGFFPDIAVAAEDKNFWTRWTPFDWWAVLRATWHNIKAGKLKEGASTIQLQAVKLFALQDELARQWHMKNGMEKNLTKWWRKGREIYLAPFFEHAYERKEILAYYLNNVPCGDNHYGVEACSWYFYGKPAKDLDVTKVITIVSCFPSPSHCASGNKETLKARRKAVMRKALRYQNEHKLEMIRWNTLRRFEKEPLLLPQTFDPCGAKHFAEFVRQEITKTRDINDRGLRIFSTIDCETQKTAVSALDASIKEMQKRNRKLTDLWGAAVVLDSTGAIAVFTQRPPFGKKDGQSEFLLDKIERHCGSTCKAFFYTAWLEQGGRLTCKDEGNGPCLLNDHNNIRINMGGKDWKTIQNFPYRSIPRYRGPSEPIICIAESRNACTMSGMKGVKNAGAEQLVSKEDILALLGRLRIPPKTINPDTAKKQGIATIDPEFAAHHGLPKNAVDPGLTVAIGSLNVSPLNMARAMGELISGKAIAPYGIVRIVDAQKQIIFNRHSIAGKKRILDEKTARAITRGLRAPVEFPHGTCKRTKQELDFTIACKTGTSTNGNGETNNNSTIAATPSHSAAVWIGRELENQPMVSYDKNGEEIQETGGKNALPVIIEIFKTLYRNRQKEEFPEETDPLKPFVWRPARPAGGPIESQAETFVPK